MDTYVYFISDITGRANTVRTRNDEVQVVTQYASQGTHMVRATPDEARHLAAGLLAAATQIDKQTGVAQQRRVAKRKAMTPLAWAIAKHMHIAGSISALEAFVDLGITSASLARRICDLEDIGFNITRERRAHPITGQRYTRYSFSQDNHHAKDN